MEKKTFKTQGLLKKKKKAALTGYFLFPSLSPLRYWFLQRVSMDSKEPKQVAIYHGFAEKLLLLLMSLKFLG